MPAKIAVSNVAKSFVKGAAPLHVIEAVDFAVGEGEFVAIVGPSGCGKTTLLSILAGFVRPDRGAVTVDGRLVDRPDPRRIVISQQGSVFPWLTVQENLMFGLAGHADAKVMADRYAAMVGLEGFETSYPHELSGGMIRRVELARALATRPEILYMDEPLSGLDALTALRLRTELLRILSEERHTVVLITHDVEEAIYLADRVLVLSPRPARIQATFEIALPRPRDMTGAAVQALKKSILSELGL